MFDIMVDLETTGTQPDLTSIIQISAVRFDLKTESVDQNWFDRCLSPLPSRFWDEDTRGWWMGKNRGVYQQIAARMEDPKLVMDAFVDWVGTSDEPIRFWSKPISFDWAFLQSYIRHFDLPNPFFYRYATDMNSFIRGMARDPMAQLDYLPKQGPSHNALIDTLNQINNLFAAVRAHGQTV